MLGRHLLSLNWSCPFYFVLNGDSLLVCPFFLYKKNCICLWDLNGPMGMIFLSPGSLVRPAIHYEACLSPDTLKRTHTVQACLSGLSVKNVKENDCSKH